MALINQMLGHDSLTFKQQLKLRAGIGICIVIAISFVTSCSEMRYGVRGKTADAKVTEVRITADPRHKDRLVHSVHYDFLDGTVMRQEYDQLPLDWPLPEVGSIVKVQYLAGKEDSSRIEGHKQMAWVYVFLGCTALGVGIFAYLWIEGTRTARRG